MTGSEEGEGAPPGERSNWVVSLVYGLCLALVLRSLFYEPFHIPSGSMKETLLVGDYIVVSKYAYGYSQYSFPFSPDISDHRFLSTDRPARGDVVVFRPPASPHVNYIKRVVGLPGDTVQMVDGVLHINDMPVGMERLPNYRVHQPDGSVVEVPRYRETLPGGHQHTILDDVPQGPYDNTYVYKVPSRHYFVMGDNRDHSTDSRATAEVGVIPEENLVGRASTIIFSIDDATRMWKLWDWPWALRSGRLFETIR